VKPTDTSNPSYYHRIVDCQWACPAHTPVPEYIRLIAQKRYTDAYMVNWQSNVFPGILGRTCDRPCEPACRRGRTEEAPVAICRLKRVAADNKGDMTSVLPTPDASNGKSIACIGAGPASLTVARDLSLLGYEVVIYDSGNKGGGMMLSQIPSFRLPESVVDEEVGFILKQGVVTHFNSEITSMKSVLDKNYDAVFVGTGAPRGRNLHIPGRQEASANIHTGIEWLANVTFEHIDSIGKRVIVLGGGNTAMDCCRTARRLGGVDVKVVVRSGFDEMKASPWEKDDALMEDIPILNYHVPKACVLDDGKLLGLQFELVKAEYDKKGRRTLVPTGEPDITIECDDVLIAIGQENSFPWIEKDIGIEFNQWDMPEVDKDTLRSSHERVFFGGDSSFGPKNIISAVGQGHQAAISIDLYCQGQSLTERPDPGVNLTSQKMGVHEWSYDNGISHEERFAVPHADKTETLQNLTLEVELGFDEQLAFDEAKRCLNCDVQTVFTESLCYECDSCMDVCPTSCINFIENGKENEVRSRLIIPAENTEQPLLVSDVLKTGRVMIKDEDLCLHCGLCAERCPTNAWDMQKFLYQEAMAGKHACSR